MTYKLNINSSELNILDNNDNVLSILKLKPEDYYVDDKGDWFFTEEGADAVSAVLEIIMKTKDSLLRKGYNGLFQIKTSSSDITNIAEV